MKTIKFTTVAVCLLTALAVAILIARRNSGTAQSTSEISETANYRTLETRARVELSSLVRESEQPKMTPGENRPGDISKPGAEDLDSSAEIFERFSTWTREYRDRTDAERSGAFLKRGEELAIARRNELKSLIETDPQRALRMAVSAELRRTVPDSISRHFEERVAGKGRLDVIASVFAPGEAARAGGIDRVVTLHSRRYKAFVYGRRLNQGSMDAVSLHGIALGAAMAVDESPVGVVDPLELADLPAPENRGHCPVSQVAASGAVAVQAGDEVFYLCDAGHIVPLTASYMAAEDKAGGIRAQALAPGELNAWTQGDRSVLFMRLNFPDDLEAPISDVDAADLMEKASALLRASSYGSLRLTARISPLLTMPRAKVWYQQNDELTVTLPAILDDARAAAAAAGLPEADLEVVYVRSGVLSNSRANVGRKGAWVVSNYPVIVAHELGHNLGLWHANAWRSLDGSSIGPGSTLEYGNPFDIMGSGSGPFNTYHKNALNWLPSSSVQAITKEGIYTLFPADATSLQEGAVYALTLRKDTSREYWFETASSLEGSLLVNWSVNPGSIGGTQLLDMTPLTSSFYDADLQPGEAFYESAAGLKIIPLGRSTTHPEAFDVLAKAVHYVEVEAETFGEAGPGIRHDPEAVEEGFAEFPEQDREVVFSVNVPATGDYSVWARTLRGFPGLARLAASVNNGPVVEIFVETSPEWSWGRLSMALPGSILGKKTFELNSGVNTLRISASNLELDSLLVTDDPTESLPPVIVGIRDQVSVGSAAVRMTFSLMEPGMRKGEARVTVRSQNQSLIRDEMVVLSGSGVNRTLDITPVPNQFGTCTIVITAVDANGAATTASFTVTLIGSVQAQVSAAAPGDSIVLEEGVYIERMMVDRDLTIEGTGVRATILDGNRMNVPITVASNARVVLKNLAVQRGRTAIRNYGHLTVVDCSIQDNISAENGGAIWNGPGATLVLQGSTLSSNRVSRLGGGIYNDGEMLLVNSTLSGNRASSKDLGGGGGIYNRGTLFLHNATLTLNRAESGGGLFNIGTLRLRSSIVAGNIADNGQGMDIRGKAVSDGYNFIQRPEGCEFESESTGDVFGKDPLLGPLQDNGGPTLTHELLAGSPAIKGGGQNDVSTDQRGYQRKSAIAALDNGEPAVTDIGAFEFGAESSSAVAISIVIVDGTARMDLKGASGSNWIVQATSDFTNWETLEIVRLDESGQATLTDETVGAQLRFYRAFTY